MFRLLFFLANLLLPGFVPTIIRYLLLIWRLTFDKRVNLFLRALVPLALIYFIVPWGLVPDRFGPFSKADDIIIMGMAIFLLIKLSPPYVVAEHLGKAPPSEKLEDEDSSKVVDGKSRTLDQD